MLTQAHPTLINHLTSTRASTIMHCIPIYESRLWFLVPKPPLFFVLQFVFSITYRARTHITWMTSGKPVVNVSMCGHIQTTTRRDPDNREINSTGKKLALRFVAYKFEFGHHPSLYPCTSCSHHMISYPMQAFPVCCWSNACYWHYSNGMVLRLDS